MMTATSTTQRRGSVANSSEVLRSLCVLGLVLLAACGDDGVHHLADAPELPDAPPDVPLDAAIDAPIDAPLDAPIDSAQNLPLTVTLAGNGGGTVTSSVGGIACGATCSHDYPAATLVTLTAQPTIGSVFTGWSGGCSGPLPMCDVTIAQATTVTATFALQTFIVTIGKIGSGTGTVTGSGIACGSTCTATVSYGTAITLNATPTTLSNFVGWGGPCSGIAMCTATITATKIGRAHV